MTKRKNNPYSHIHSFQDFENEKIRLFYQLKLTEKKLEIKSIELGVYLNPMNLVPALLSDWLKPVLIYIKDYVVNFFKKNDKKTSRQESQENTQEEMNKED
ncbi:hypothetical protein DMA11_22005 [Marinilabiliaceae bacterium JC017]|nr:hypothetical protein DMA11_22005 [Marinilabiliaceae bacterium JC017]